LDLLAPLDTQQIQEPQALRARQELVALVPLVWMELQDLQGLLVLQDLLVLQELLAQLDLLAPLDTQQIQEPLDLLDRQDLSE